MSLQIQMDEFHNQLKKGVIQQAYRGLLAYISGLKAHFQKNYPVLSISDGIYAGYLDMTYFALAPETFKRRKLKIAVVFNYDLFRFEIWLSAVNRQVQAEYRRLFEENSWERYPLVELGTNPDAIIEHVLCEKPDFDQLDVLTEKIEREVFRFIADLESFFTGCQL